MYKKSDKAELTVRDKMQLILDIGQLMMENGASSKRVVRDMLRAAAYLGIYWENVQIHITYSTIMINVDDGVTSETMFRKCYKHGVNMMTTLLANQLSWDALTSNESYLIYRNQMMTIQQMARKRLYPQWLTLFCIGMASSAFCLLFGGHWYEALYTFIAAVVGAYVKTLCERFGVNIYIGIAASAFFATATAYAVPNRVPRVTSEPPYAGGRWRRTSRAPASQSRHRTRRTGRYRRASAPRRLG